MNQYFSLAFFSRAVFSVLNSTTNCSYLFQNKTNTYCSNFSNASIAMKVFTRLRNENAFVRKQQRICKQFTDYGFYSLLCLAAGSN